MKKIVPLIFIMFAFNIINAQEKNKKQILFIGAGSPVFMDKDRALNNYAFSINYQNRFSESFALDGFYSYAQSNNYPGFINNSQQLDQFLRNLKNSEIFERTLWSSIYTHSIGAKIHYSFVNNNKFYFSFSYSGGIIFSKSSIFNLKSIEYNPATGSILNYTDEISKDTDTQLFYGPGLSFQYTLPKNYIVGFEATGYFAKQKESGGLITIPVITDYYNLSILFGKKF